MFIEFHARLFHVVFIGLDPLKPVSLKETRWHLFNTPVPDILLERSDTVSFEICDIIPAKVDATDVFGRFILCNHSMPVWLKVVSFEGHYILCILLVVAGVVWVVTRWRFDRLLQLLQVLFVCPLDI